MQFGHTMSDSDANMSFGFIFSHTVKFNVCAIYVLNMRMQIIMIGFCLAKRVRHNEYIHSLCQLLSHC